MFVNNDQHRWEHMFFCQPHLDMRFFMMEKCATFLSSLFKRSTSGIKF